MAFFVSERKYITMILMDYTFVHLEKNPALIVSLRTFYQFLLVFYRPSLARKTSYAWSTAKLPTSQIMRVVDGLKLADGSSLSRANHHHFLVQFVPTTKPRRFEKNFACIHFQNLLISDI